MAMPISMLLAVASRNCSKVLGLGAGWVKCTCIRAAIVLLGRGFGARHTMAVKDIQDHSGIVLLIQASTMSSGTTCRV